MDGCRVSAGEADADLGVCRYAPTAKSGKRICQNGATCLSCSARGAMQTQLPLQYFAAFRRFWHRRTRKMK
eukprot:1179486-Prorocentrum_minimum.AAC.6